uniref:Olfactory receptor 22 n=1 Tax=Meteorus pulchricornis TaxID=51522 RepID=A0A1S5VFK8_9HYME|nr:olfactory receptor 22 [Meteorus pulchricornis]
MHAYMTVPISLGIFVFAENIFAMYTHHACALFTTLRLHLESIHSDIHDYGNIESGMEPTQKLHRKIVMCVNMHENVIKFSNELESSGNMSYLIILMINVSMITITGIVTVMKFNTPSESARFFAFTMGNVVYTFATCLMGQKLIDESEIVFHAAYSFEWYTLPMNLQSMVIPIMVKSLNPCQLTAGKIMSLSMDTFSLVLKNAMSLFTVLSSLR